MRSRGIASVVTVIACALSLLAASVPTGVARAATDGSDAPSHWDPRVERYARFVERERGLTFEHPVKVEFLAEKAFRRAASTWYDDVSEKDQELAELEGGDLLALGLVTAPLDVLAAEESSDVEGTVGFYDPTTEELVVRGKDLDDVDVRVTVVHELTHALQDQHFDLDELDRRTRSNGESTALTALIEGDATRVEFAYVRSLPRREQDEYWDDTSSDDGADASTPSSPLAFDLWSAFDYDLAPTALDLVVAAHGKGAVDASFRSPPRSEEQILDPVALDIDDGPKHVRLPLFADGERPRGPASEWGAFSWYLVLSSRIPWSDALTAVEGWGGDRYRSYERVVDGVNTQCVRLVVTGDSGADTNELEAAIGAWAAAMHAGAVRVAANGGVVVVSACPTGVAPTSGDEAMDAAYERLWERNDQMLSAVNANHTLDARTRCVATVLVDDADVGPLLYIDRARTKGESATIDRELEAAFDDCR